MWPYTILAPPYEPNMNLLGFLLKLMNLRQNLLLGRLFKIIIIFFLYSLFFGSLGDGEMRRNIVRSLISFMSKWYKLENLS